MQSHPARTLIATVVLVFGLLAITILTGNSPKLGLDLQGGISVNLQPVEDGEVTSDVTDEQLDQAIEIIRKRVDAVGVSEPEVSRQGNTITVQLPGAKDQNEVLDLVGKTAQLEFRPVLSTVGQTLSGEDRTKAEADVEQLRKDLGVPDGVTAQQVAEDEQAKTPQPTIDPNAPTDPNAAGATATTAAPEATAGPDEQGAGADATSGDLSTGNGGSRSAALRAQDDATTTTTAAPTTTVPPTPLNQYGVNVYDDKFGELFQLENQLSAELTPPAEQTPEGEVTLAGEDGTIYKLGPVALTGTAVEGATASLGTNGQWTVNPSFKAGADGIDLFNAVAAQCYNGEPTCPPLSAEGRGLLGIVLDDVVLSAPSINVASFSRDQIQISGSFTKDEAESLAVALRYGSLPIELQPQQAENVSATLGQGALQAGIISGLIGLIVAALYLGLYYRLLAAVAMAGLVVAATALYVIMSFIGATVTLAGVVGLVVSIGVTVDSAVVYYESMKEQVRSGVSVRAAADRSFSVAWSTIVKANFASLIGAGVLYWLAVGPVRGFAFYLGAMTILDMIALYVFVYPATALLARSGNGRHPARLGMPKSRAESAAEAASDGPLATAGTSTGASS